ncbi:tRNA (cytosine34-C5)-methyltransferase [Trypanosoma theileri]|uniref:tRNA (Cytosine34-C5)-methyltransferase n=1 Tax=Trypanosoma theileri TaxID=67003 RepID=A0A1X0P924_9TRYP|nr:tRNA (cytosine34-C5)-methyltransferase [Trypanosoma theileri]ORC93434.1 tRNA (cytosine34-C5)-methyltransferase [Trypanosoma theileri]
MSQLSRNQNRKGGGRRRGRSDSTWATDQRNVATLTNAAFDAYYEKTVAPAGEWPALQEALRTPLPMALRVHPTAPQPDDVLEFLQARLNDVLPTRRIPFVSCGRALQCSVSRGDLKRSAELKGLKKIISALNEGGYITRQETVSMIPPVLLQVKPGQRVLDMCAAPGSKTSQILEALIPSMEDGVVVANDLNTSRLDVLMHQTNRSAGSHPHLIVTHYDATQFPLLPPEEKFDRVLCDVMCSGDGTLRKSVDMWPRWNTLQGPDLHCTQIRVLTRGMMLCKKGGIIVYSTCSMNPVEDEAVVSECLAQANGAFRLIDPTPLVPGLIASPGLTDWSLLTKDLSTWLHNIEEAQAYTEKQNGRGFRYHASMFPNTERLKAQGIHYTRRILPHHQDTGGFFVAVMECVEDYPIDTKTTTTTTINNNNNNVKSETFKVISPPLQEVVRRALDLPESFPMNQLFVRNETAREQKIYFANKAVCELLPKLGPRVVHVGSKIIESFAKYSNDKLRFSMEGIATVKSLLPSTFVVEVSPELVLQFSRSKLLLSALPTLPPHNSFIISCNMSVVGYVYIAAEKTRTGQVSAKVSEWHITLAKLTLGQPLVEGNVDNETEAGAEIIAAGDDNNDEAAKSKDSQGDMNGEDGVDTCNSSDGNEKKKSKKEEEEEEEKKEEEVKEDNKDGKKEEKTILEDA